jgi:hypothetical protein
MRDLREQLEVLFSAGVKIVQSRVIGVGRDIPQLERRPGPAGYRLCDICAKLK